MVLTSIFAVLGMVFFALNHPGTIEHALGQSTERTATVTRVDEVTSCSRHHRGVYTLEWDDGRAAVQLADDTAGHRCRTRPRVRHRHRRRPPRLVPRPSRDAVRSRRHLAPAPGTRPGQPWERPPGGCPGTPPGPAPQPRPGDPLRSGARPFPRPARRPPRRRRPPRPAAWALAPHHRGRRTGLALARLRPVPGPAHGMGDCCQ